MSDLADSKYDIEIEPVKISKLKITKQKLKREISRLCQVSPQLFNGYANLIIDHLNSKSLWPKFFAEQKEANRIRVEAHKIYNRIEKWGA